MAVLSIYTMRIIITAIQRLREDGDSTSSSC
jgi:hypothetical protein